MDSRVFLADISPAVGQSGQQPESFKRFSTVFSSGEICMKASLIINEVVSGTEKFQLERRLRSDDRLRFGLRFQSLFQNVLQAVDVEQVEVESPPAGGVQAGGAVAFGQAQQLLRLTQTAPGGTRRPAVDR